MAGKFLMWDYYTKEELYDFWLRFRTDPNAAKILSDFMNANIQSAKEVIKKFEKGEVFANENEDRR